MLNCKLADSRSTARVARLLPLALLLVAATPGRDFVPGEDSTEGPVSPLLAQGTVHNTLLFNGQLYLFYGKNSTPGLFVRRFDPSTAGFQTS